jgi:hypothetical protein
MQENRREVPPVGQGVGDSVGNLKASRHSFKGTTCFILKSVQRILQKALTTMGAWNIVRAFSLLSC